MGAAAKTAAAAAATSPAVLSYGGVVIAAQWNGNPQARL